MAVGSVPRVEWPYQVSVHIAGQLHLSDGDDLELGEHFLQQIPLGWKSIAKAYAKLHRDRLRMHCILVDLIDVLKANEQLLFTNLFQGQQVHSGWQLGTQRRELRFQLGALYLISPLL